MSDGSEFQVYGAAIENARLAKECPPLIHTTHNNTLANFHTHAQIFRGMKEGVARIGMHVRQNGVR